MPGTNLCLSDVTGVPVCSVRDVLLPLSSMVPGAGHGVVVSSISRARGHISLNLR